jgi:glutamate-ammonia-ligase adenylyltransferase
VLYETDLRLRPDGAAGLLVSSLSAFADYQRKRAWTWEHQALTRARFCAGDAALGARFERLRDEVLSAPRERSKLFAEIVAMRRKMRSESKSAANDLKQIAGGIIDLEFCVQALVLADGRAIRSCARTRATTRCSSGRATAASSTRSSPRPRAPPTSLSALASTRRR